MDNGLAERSITLNPYIRPSSIGDGAHSIYRYYRHPDDPALLSFESIMRSEQSTGLALQKAGANTELHIIPRDGIRGSIDPVYAHSVDRFIDRPLPTTNNVGTRPTHSNTNRLVGIQSISCRSVSGGAGAGIGVGVVTSMAADGLGITDLLANAAVSGAFGTLAEAAVVGAGVGSIVGACGRCSRFWRRGWIGLRGRI